MKTLKILLLTTICFSLFLACQSKDEKYQCLPCGSDCDTAVFDKPGKCSDCKMDLVKSSSIVFQNIAPDSVCDYLAAHPKTILLDVRTRDEYEGKSDPNYGTLKRSINIPIQELEKRIVELRPYQNKTIIVYCSRSRRSPQASYLLTKNGFKNIINMSGGMSMMNDSNCKK